MHLSGFDVLTTTLFFALGGAFAYHAFRAAWPDIRNGHSSPAGREHHRKARRLFFVLIFVEVTLFVVHGMYRATVP